MVSFTKILLSPANQKNQFPGLHERRVFLQIKIIRRLMSTKWSLYRISVIAEPARFHFPRGCNDWSVTQAIVRKYYGIFWYQFAPNPTRTSFTKRFDWLMIILGLSSNHSRFKNLFNIFSDGGEFSFASVGLTSVI